MYSIQKQAVITIGSVFALTVPAYSQVGSMGLCGTGSVSVAGTAEITSAKVDTANVSGAVVPNFKVGTFSRFF